MTDNSQANQEGAAAGAPNSPLKSQGIPLAVEIGWTMAVLYGVAGP